MSDSNRPLSPHIGIYSWRITSTLSILHRASGIVMSMGSVLLVGWLLALANGPESYASFREFTMSVTGQLVLVAISAAFFYHLLNGVRHLFWDAGKGFELETARRSGWAVVAGSIVLTVAFWVLAKP